MGCDVDDVLPQVLDDIEEPVALDQLIPVFCVLLLLLLYDGVGTGEMMLVMPMVGLDCCCGGANDGLPMPGFMALSAGKEELRELSVLSGVMVRL